MRPGAIWIVPSDLEPPLSSPGPGFPTCTAGIWIEGSLGSSLPPRAQVSGPDWAALSDLDHLFLQHLWRQGWGWLSFWLLFQDLLCSLHSPLWEPRVRQGTHTGPAPDGAQAVGSLSTGRAATASIRGDTQFSATEIIVGDSGPINPRLPRHLRLKYV